MRKSQWTDVGYFATERRDLSGIRRVLVVTMVLNFLATAIKLATGIATGSLSVVADGLDSLFDGLSNVVGLAGLWAASKPPDAEHPYGHRKFETVAALSISFLLFLTAWQLLQTAWSRLGSGVTVEINAWTGGAMLLSMLVQAGTSFYELRQGRRLNSEILVADALHTRASILVSLSVLGGLGLVVLGFPQADAILAAFVALVIAKIGVDILRENLPVLVDQAAIDPYEIAEIVQGVEGVKSFHRVRSRGAAGSAAVDLHVQVDPERTLQQANTIADEVRRRLLQLDEITDVTVHLEAQRDPLSGAADIFSTLRLAAEGLGLVVHEAWVHSIEGSLTVELHVGVSPSLTLAEAHGLVDRLEAEIRSRLPQMQGVHTHIELADSQIHEFDRAPGEIERRIHLELGRAAAGIPNLQSLRNIVVRRDRNGDGRLFISVDCTVPPGLPVAQAHDLATQLERELNRRLNTTAEVSVHLEPGEIIS
jgi:cation diffusion facilitator family transporter